MSAVTTLLEGLENCPLPASEPKEKAASGIGALLEGLKKQLEPALSPAVVTRLLREELGFQGVVFTDDLTMGAITQSWDMGQAAVLAVQRGGKAQQHRHRRRGEEQALKQGDQRVSSLSHRLTQWPP